MSLFFSFRLLPPARSLSLSTVGAVGFFVVYPSTVASAGRSIIVKKVMAPPRKTPKRGYSIGPSTPTSTHSSYTVAEHQPHHDPSSPRLELRLGPTQTPRRRSLRLATKSISGSDTAVPSPCLTGKETSVSSRLVAGLNHVKDGEEIGSLELGSMGKAVVALSDCDSDSDEENGGKLNEPGVVRVGVGVGSEGKEELGVETIEFPSEETSCKKSGTRKSADKPRLQGYKEGEDVVENGYWSLRSGTKIAKRKLGEGKNAVPDEVVGCGEELNALGTTKGKEVMMLDQDDVVGDQVDNRQSGIGLAVCMDVESGGTKFTREEKGKGKLVYDGGSLMQEQDASLDLDFKLGIDSNVSAKPEEIINQPVPNPVDEGDEASATDNVILPNLRHRDDPQPANNNQGPNIIDVAQVDDRLRQFKQVAKDNASKFARVTYAPDTNDSDDEMEAPEQEGVQNIEDWPGPFSTAMKIIRDREKEGIALGKNISMEKSSSPPLVWTSRTDKVSRKDYVIPMLQDLCLKVLAKNSDSLTSLDFLPDALRHKLSHMICSSRMMTGRCLDLLFEGSPFEIRVPDCSSITEEQLEGSFQHCNTSNLMVLELNLCGRCMPDYTLTRILASKRFPVLTTISLQGACRLSDVGLTELISAAPALRSINLSQCSLLTDVGVNAIARLGPNLQELYLDDCQNLNAMLILPALKKLEHLEVLSLAGISSVSDGFLKSLIGSNGKGMKELVLANCTRLTNKSLKVIGETCSELCALDLTNVIKLSDSGIGYLTDGCPNIQNLKLCHHIFSDEAVAAFVETSGESLKELSLNSVSKVGAHTAISVGRRCKKLQSLDVSFCRNLTDEALGLIADSCLSLRVLNVFGCTQISQRFVKGHSNPNLNVIGINLTPILEHLRESDYLRGPLCYRAVPSS